ncbi:MAG TPA: hypothetical protein VF733_01905 [Candidatus Saccharimonadales bacterium]
MTDHVEVPPHEDPKYLNLLKGVCPNTGRRCEALGDLLFRIDVTRDSFKMGAGTNFSFDAMTAGQQEAYNRQLAESQKHAETIQRILGGSCIDSCGPQEAL